MSDVVKRSGETLAPELRLGPDALELARRIADDIKAAQAARSNEAQAPEQALAEVEFESPAGFHRGHPRQVRVPHPLTGYFFNANDVWVQVAGRQGPGRHLRLHAAAAHRHHLRGPAQSSARTIEQFDEVGTVESTKANFEIVSPVSGTVVRINEAVTDAPESINEDPYGSWIVELELTAWEEDRGLLVDGPAYAAEVERKAAED